MRQTTSNSPTFASLPSRTPINVEIKGRTKEEETAEYIYNAEVLARELRVVKRDDLIVASFQQPAVDRFHELLPRIANSPGIAGVAVCFLLWKVLYATRFGIAVRAVIDDPRAAELAGINVGGVSLGIFALASAIGGLTGFLIVASHEQVTPMLGMWSTLKGMLAMMLGGLGSLPGAVAGGLALGLIEAHSQWYLGPQFRDFIAYLLLFVLLAARPPWMNTRSAF